MPCPVRPGRGVLAEEDGDLVGVLDGAEAGEAWHVTRLVVSGHRLKELGPRVLAVADALASEDGLVVVALDGSGYDEAWQALFAQEGFRPTGQGAWLSRPVVPQG
jgi:hypothetical protein